MWWPELYVVMVIGLAACGSTASIAVKSYKPLKKTMDVAFWVGVGLFLLKVWGKI